MGLAKPDRLGRCETSLFLFLNLDNRVNNT
nr:MAG TPA: hypothetical protein [Caudoviricetes sp.]